VSICVQLFQDHSRTEDGPAASPVSLAAAHPPATAGTLAVSAAPRVLAPTCPDLSGLDGRQSVRRTR
jgi:hypothetical protein